MVAETESFLELDIWLVKKILSSSELNTTSELEVMKAASAWISHKNDERSQFATDLFLKVRFTLLPEQVLKKVLQKSKYRDSYVFQRNEKCLLLAREILRDKDSFYQKNPLLNHTSRYCSHIKYKVLLSGLEKTVSNEIQASVYQVDGKHFNKVKRVTNIPEQALKHCEQHTVLNVKHEIYLLFFSLSQRNDTNIHV